MKKETTIREITEAEYTAIRFDNSKNFNQVIGNKDYTINAENRMDDGATVIGGIKTANGYRFFICDDGKDSVAAKTDTMMKKIASLM